MTDYKVLHRLIRGTAGLAVDSFFKELRVVGGENVPMTGPIIVCVLLAGAKRQELMNYFAPPALRRIII
jgi:hypothetical protein